jgi:hypothetical protein
MVPDLLDRIDHAYRVARVARWGWPALRWPEDAWQSIAVAAIELPEASAVTVASRALGQLARDMGYRRHCGRRSLDPIPCRTPYIIDAARKRAARMKMSPERRREIARMGAAARWGRVTHDGPGIRGPN